MKKIKILILISFLIPINIYATSGACSYHGGVDCTKKYTQLKVVCNDGWTDSSVNYSDMQECKLKLNTCAYPTQTRCDVSSIETQRDNALGSSRAIQGRSGTLGTPFAENQDAKTNEYYSPMISACNAQNTAYQSQLDQYNTCLKTNEEMSRKDAEQFNLMMKNIIFEINNKQNEIRTDTKEEVTNKKQGVGLTLDQLQKMGAKPVIKVSESKKTTNTVKDNIPQKTETIVTTASYNSNTEIVSTTTSKVEIPKKIKWYQKIFRWFYR